MRYGKTMKNVGRVQRRAFRSFLVAVLAFLPFAAAAEPGDVRTFKSPQTTTAHLRIHGSTDIENFAAVIADYQRLSPGTEVEYSDLVAQDIYSRFLRTAPRQRPDLLISSGMDLQTKLANDGHALAHRSPATAGLPAWSQWRHEAFGISYEPIVIVYNKRLLAPAQVPRTRRQLLALLRDPAAKLAGRVGTYDVGRSSVGYLLATQDHQLGSMAGALQAALGDNRVFFSKDEKRKLKKQMKELKQNPRNEKLAEMIGYITYMEDMATYVFLTSITSN